uniref:Uncharacterized protein n=1 Tax=Oryza rufipogon TaxID=4529 RepID=A0A0E0RFT3_ORYRU
MATTMGGAVGGLDGDRGRGELLLLLVLPLPRGLVLQRSRRRLIAAGRDELLPLPLPRVWRRLGAAGRDGLVLAARSRKRTTCHSESGFDKMPPPTIQRIKCHFNRLLSGYFVTLEDFKTKIPLDVDKLEEGGAGKVEIDGTHASRRRAWGVGCDGRTGRGRR